ncbi:hypothetical protein [Tepidibacter formicigenes]|jgi:hypothetical protein|uniref:DarT domain-containing protein n=1 Tax=Tepidibacter formicigenes DSM 15518 TaxID=1123349 RepID=A0A1M6MEM6_9FIRM|nr:hypothetical protein [Tepidibacter formicigenes]SHJ81919.1 hypothetical protein SAMN02744037_00912 [Tepidibacter formicigenes DSM 15518]
MKFLFDDYTKTKRVYHIVALRDLDYVLKNGIYYNDKITYNTKYKGFHDYIDDFRRNNIPNWVERRKSIFASLNFKEKHYFHSHSAVLSVKINEDMCWIANENLANKIYEPFALKETKGFEFCSEFLHNKGKDILKEYWNSSLSFKDNLKIRKDLEDGYDAEILICHHIPKEDIEVLYICSDHERMNIEEFKKQFS